MWGGLVVAIGVCTVVALVVVAVRDLAAPVPSPRPTSRQPISAPRLWAASVPKLRPDLADPSLVGPVDGSFGGPAVLDAGTAWIVLTGGSRESQLTAHALDPNTGAALWERPLPDGVCAAQLLDGALVCAASLTRDPISGQQSRWRLVLLDPATGAERASAVRDGDLQSIAVADGRVLLLGQRPGPRAVIEGLSADLRPAFLLDLGTKAPASLMFSDNHIIARQNQPALGPRLDRPRVRHVGGGLTAFWVGRAAAFVDARKGRLVGVRACSRLVDDGARLWCNEPDHAQSYDYRLWPGVRTPAGIRLAFPSLDGANAGRGPAVFFDEAGRVMKVNPATGEVGGVLFDSSLGQAFGMATWPNVVTTYDLTLVSDDAKGLALVEPTQGRVRWTVPDRQASVAFLVGDRLVVGGRGTLAVLDAGTGRLEAEYAGVSDWAVERVGDALVVGDGQQVVRLAGL